ncbi:hypothetical protein ASPWEDRAFT_122156 [Aspergillus wentii DTO 134E9]|uniref:Actin binding protein n=1 Tax=Aspergillus wentii DTO 134E9 TaxID=1073089 RepID=A0A1L9R542_ASPWE|nr:uncharacterized protein ASPWEDRAFT_122156 [Aspergillus wentii DTO 134E9]KAI9927326.1 hypothetical protein MW887_003713 [Aspergillus wentii]OJJ30055.1 hypothetical protein ASPWEDRAFT_122156 [Aspergillus wentii DTO 134E9]
MASLNLSSNGPSITKSYQTVVNASIPASSPTFGQWAVFSVSTPLVNVFQQDTGNKESVLKVQSTGEGELTDLIEEFSEGKVQFAYVKVTDPNTQLPKNVLIAWCGDGVPERTKGYFTSHLSAVSKLLHGYHVQVTARSDGDLTSEGIIQKVADSSGAKYSSGIEAPPISTTSKPSIASKPVFTPTRNGGVGINPVAAISRSGPSHQNSMVDDDGWGPDAPPVTRTQLEKVQPAYKPTRVNIHDLKSQHNPTSTEKHGDATETHEGIVKGGYQPVGKVDIAAIRRQAREAGDLKDDRPGPVKGAYEPVGKVDIAAIRSKAQRSSDSPGPAHVNSGAVAKPQAIDDFTTLPDQATISSPTGRLSSLPKPKVSNKFGTAPSFTGTKPPLPSDFAASKPTPAGSQIGSASRNFAVQGGKTPAQLWGEKKAKERELGGGQIPSTPAGTEIPIRGQHSGKGDWKSSYTGKTWAPVQTTHTGKSTGSNFSQQAADISADEENAESRIPKKSINAVRDQFAHDSPKETSSPEKNPETSSGDTGRSVPLPGLPNASMGPEIEQDSEPQRAIPSPPNDPRSPTPPIPSPVRESSPIRVAIPVGRGVADSYDEQSSPATLPIENAQQLAPSDTGFEDISHDNLGRATAESTATGNQLSGGIRAIVQYDYEKAEDNEIELSEGEYVTDIEMVDKDWWLGVNFKGERGLFPSNYVELVGSDEQIQLPSDPHAHEEADARVPPNDSPVPLVSKPDNGSVAMALYDYEAAEDNELSFPEGAEILNIEFPDDDWWFGEYSGKKGLFPANYVQLSR